MTESRQQPTGEPQRLSIGVITAPQGLQGEVRMQIWTQFPERIPCLKRIYLGDEAEPRRLRRAQVKGSLAILRIEGVTNRDGAEQLRGQTVRIAVHQATPLEEGEYYHFQLLDLEVVDETGNQLGRLAEILETGANDVYVVKDDQGRELLLPALANVILEIDLDAGRIVARLPDYAEG